MIKEMAGEIFTFDNILKLRRFLLTEPITDK